MPELTQEELDKLFDGFSQEKHRNVSIGGANINILRDTVSDFRNQIKRNPTQEEYIDIEGRIRKAAQNNLETTIRNNPEITDPGRLAETSEIGTRQLDTIVNIGQIASGVETPRLAEEASIKEQETKEFIEKQKGQRQESQERVSEFFEEGGRAVQDILRGTPSPIEQQADGQPTQQFTTLPEELSGFEFLETQQVNPLLTQGTDARFNEILASIQGPTGIEDVQQQLDNERLQQILGDIGRRTEADVATQRSAFAERGLTGPGATSDIAENALAQIIAGGGRSAAGASVDVRLGELQRLRQRESEIRALSTQLLGLEFGGQESQLGREQGRVLSAADILANQRITSGSLQTTRDIEGARIGAQLSLGVPQNILGTQRLGFDELTGERQFGLNLSQLEQQAQQAQLDRELRERIAILSGEQALAQIGASKPSTLDQVLTGSQIAGNLISIGGGGGGKKKIPTAGIR